MTTSTTSKPGLGTALRRIYLTRAAFAVIWAVVLFLTAPAPNPLLTVLLVLYPLVDAGAVFLQIRAEGQARGPRPAELGNVVLSVLAAIALGWASTISAAAVLVAWGVWAIVSGLAQLIAAILRRSSGGQVPLMISGAISVLAGAAFATQGLQGGTVVVGVGGYAILGGIFFLVAGIRLSILQRKAS
ncbi:DUF308 domain-containing protein [Microbacterium timonense]|uniref:DUF308 domain-containing protein n=1 Tax=Microbacterium timonense TaxID=2086576 RepID=UPI000D113FDE|nr:DUF308 domain-containing protein [Microbacterium timonense]